MVEDAWNETTILRSAFWIAGPTASGKSHLALELAEAIQAEIISVDSMQVYRGMDIGTAKASLADQARIPHHMIDLVDVRESFDVARFRKEALRAAQDIHDRGRNIIFCGGTGFYLQALILGIGNSPPSDPSIREALDAHSMEWLMQALKQEDFDTYKKIDLQNKRKIVRALEVVRLTGKSFTSFKSTRNFDDSVDSSRFWILEHTSPVLRNRIESRVDEMFAMGWVDETQQLMQRGLRENTTACQAIGYRQIMDYLDGSVSLSDVIALIKTKTWQYAKRQRTWFRHQARGKTILLEGESSEVVFRNLIKSAL